MINKTARAEFLQEMLDIIEPIIDINTGSNDDWIYGNYIEWKPLEDLDDTIICSLCEYFNISIQLPKEKIFNLLRKNDIPEGTMYEFDIDFPESAKYWKSEFDEYEYYLEHNIAYEEYITQIEIIINLACCNQHDLIKKSLILSAFILTENFIKSKIVSKIRKEETIKSHFYKELIDNSIKNDLRSTDGRKKLFKILFTENRLENIPNVGIRNYLAHDIGNASILNDEIIYLDNNEKSKTADIKTVFQELKKFVEELNEIQ